MASIGRNGKLSSSRLYSTQSGKIGVNSVTSYLKVNPNQSLNNKDGFVQSQRSEEISAIKARIQELPDVDDQKIEDVQQSLGSYYSDGNGIADHILSVSIQLLPTGTCPSLSSICRQHWKGSLLGFGLTRQLMILLGLLLVLECSTRCRG